MSAKILDGKVFAAKITESVKDGIVSFQEKFQTVPGLAVIIVGGNPASKVYVANKHRSCKEVGIYSEVIEMPAESTKEMLLEKIDELNRNVKIHGILVQLPLPEQMKADEAEILASIHPDKDVDGFHPVNAGRLSLGQESLTPCTPLGCMRMLELAGIDAAGKRAVIIGRSNIVGKPMFHLLLAQNATVTVCHSRTKDLAKIAREADILVAAVGRPHFVTADMVKKGAVVIDVGINRIAPKKLVGDVDFENVKEVASAITPVPGGVGLLTIATLMHNTLKAANLQMQGN